MLLPGIAKADPPNSPEYVALVNNTPQKGCLDPDGTDGVLRANVRVGTCDGQPDQRWWFRPVSGENGLFELVNEKSGLCLDVQGYDADEKDNVMLYTCDGKRDQWWKFRWDGSKFRLQNAKGGFYQIPPGQFIGTWYDICLDVDGSGGYAGDIGDNVHAYRCNESWPAQAWTKATSGVAVKPPTTSSGSSKLLCATDYGPCFEGIWNGSGSTWTATGRIVLSKLAALGTSLELTTNPSISANLSASTFAVTGGGALKAKLPLGSEVVDVSLPNGNVAIGFGAGIASILGKGMTYAIGGRPYRLQNAGFYAHAAVNSKFEIQIAGITASVPDGGAAEVFLGFESLGPSLYLSGDCNIPIVGPPKVQGGPPTSIANISSCTLGWFGTRPLPHKLSTPILDSNASLPSVGAALPTVQPTIDSAILMGGAIEFAALPGVTFDGMMALDPDATVANSVTFRDLSKAKAGLEGSATVGAGGFSMPMGSVSMVFDAAKSQIDFGGNIPVLEPFKAIGATFGTNFSGTAYAAGRISPNSSAFVFDFSNAKVFGFELGSFRGQLDLATKTIAVAGKIKFGEAWTAVSGTFGPNSFSLKGSSALVLDGKTLSSSSISIGTSGVTVKGGVSLLGKSWTFSETLTTPSTIRAKAIDVAITIPGTTIGGTLEVWAQYSMGGTLSVRAKAKQDFGVVKTSQTYTLDSEGKITVSGIKIPVL